MPSRILAPLFAAFLPLAAYAAPISSYDLTYTFDAEVISIVDHLSGDVPEDPAPFEDIFEGYSFQGSLKLTFSGQSVDSADCSFPPGYCGAIYSLDTWVESFDPRSGALTAYFSDTSNQSWYDLVPGGTGSIVYDAEWTPLDFQVATFRLSNISVEGLAPVPLPGTVLLYLTAAAGFLTVRRRT